MNVKVQPLAWFYVEAQRLAWLYFEAESCAWFYVDAQPLAGFHVMLVKKKVIWPKPMGGSQARCQVESMLWGRRPHVGP